MGSLIQSRRIWEPACAEADSRYKEPRSSYATKTRYCDTVGSEAHAAALRNGATFFVTFLSGQPALGIHAVRAYERRILVCFSMLKIAILWMFLRHGRK